MIPPLIKRRNACSFFVYYEDILKKYGTSAGSYISGGTTSAKEIGTYYIYWDVDSNHCWSGGSIETKSDYWTIKGIGSESCVGKYIDSDNNGYVNGIIFYDNQKYSSSYPDFYYSSIRCPSNSTYHSSQVRITDYSYANRSSYYSRFSFVEIESCTSSSNYTTAYNLTAYSSTSVSYSINDTLGDNDTGSLPNISELASIYNYVGTARFGTKIFASSQASSWSVLGYNFAKGQQCYISDDEELAILVDYR